MADFINKMKDSLNKGVATVSTGSKTMIEKTKVYTTIKNLENEKKQIAELLGNKVYSFCDGNAEGDIPRSEVMSFCEEIKSRIEQIEVQRKKLEELDAEMSQVIGGTAGASDTVCSCGHENNPGAKFCAKCGSKLG